MDATIAHYYYYDPPSWKETGGLPGKQGHPRPPMLPLLGAIIAMSSGIVVIIARLLTHLDQITENHVTLWAVSGTLGVAALFLAVRSLKVSVTAGREESQRRDHEAVEDHNDDV